MPYPPNGPEVPVRAAMNLAVDGPVVVHVRQEQRTGRTESIRA